MKISKISGLFYRNMLGILLACLLMQVQTGFTQSSTKQANQSHKNILYNGIELPALWPPDNYDPVSAEPMPVPYLKELPSVFPINLGRQLFIDDFLIEKTTLQRNFHQAEKYDGNPVFYPATYDELTIKADNTAVTSFSQGGVFFDPADQLFKMFYRAGWRGGLALATSKDLINWQRPQLNLVRDNIILPPGPLMAGGDNSIWLDLNAKDTMQRYKALIQRLVDGTWVQNFKTRNESPTHTLHISPDGRIWSQGITTGRAADYTSFFYNPFRNIWVYSLKQNNSRGRIRYYAESENFLKGAGWENKVYWSSADILDKPDPLVGDSAQLYSLNAIAYESILLGQFFIHLGPHNKIAEEGRFPKITELKLGFSRDGFHWDRPDRRPFINASRSEEKWDRAYLNGTTGVCVIMGDKIWFPYCGYSGKAPDGSTGMYTGASIGLASLRRDGFASMEAGKKTGMLLTRPVVFDGSYLFVNVDCPQGALSVEIVDENDKIIQPFSAKNSITVRTDKTLQAISWKGAEDLSKLHNKPVKFRFHLTNGKLYSFWVSPDKSGASYGYIGAGAPGYDGVIDNKGINAY